MDKQAEVNLGTIKISAGPRLRAAMILAIVADALQLVVFPYSCKAPCRPR